MIDEKVREFIIDTLGCDVPRTELGNDYPIIEGKAVDSLGIFHIVSFVEREFDVEVQDDELVPENFGTIGSIATLIQSKLDQRG